MRKWWITATVVAVGLVAAPSAMGYAKPVMPKAHGPYVSSFALVRTVGPGKASAAAVSNTPQGYGPSQLLTAYGLKTLAATRGVGQTVAIVDAFDDPHALSDVNHYRATFGLPKANFKKVKLGSPPFDQGWTEEISLDLDMVSAIAPNAKILLVEAKSNSFADIAAAVNKAASLGATQISNSYGGDESFGGSFNSAYNHPGKAVTASTGDDGYYGDHTSAMFPAASQYVEGVGGTSLTSIAPRQESVWDGAGSGVSTLFPQPSWQAPFLSFDAGGFRVTGDVSAVADPNTGVAVYDSLPPIGGWAVFGGTSASAPIIASFDALLGSPLSSAQWFYQHPSLLNDVTGGSNGFSDISNQLTDGIPGYDAPSGIGTPNGKLVGTPIGPAKPQITQHPGKNTSSHKATFRFKDITAGVKFQVRLGSNAWSFASSPVRYSGLSKGTHVFYVRAVKSGTTSSTASFGWKVK